MTSSHYSQVTDELLSAYVDEAVSAEERAFVEAALAAEPQIAWRLESLRQTVQLLRSLPAVVRPRDFTLTKLPAPAVVAPGMTARPVAGLRTPARRATLGVVGLWPSIRNFWSIGSPLLRNAAAVSFALLLVFTAGDLVFTPAPAPVTNQTTVLATTNAVEAPAVNQAAQPTTAQPTATSIAEPTSAEAVAEAPSAVPQPDAQQETAPVPMGAVTSIQSPASSASTALGDTGQASAESVAATASSRTAPVAEQGAEQNGWLDEFDARTAEEELAEMPAESLAKAMQRASEPITKTTDAPEATNDTVQPTAADAAADEPQVDVTTSAEPTEAVTTTPMPTASTAVIVAGTVENTAVPDIAPTISNEHNAVMQGASGWSAVTLLQSLTALLTLLFAALWWRSRSRAVHVVEQ